MISALLLPLLFGSYVSAHGYLGSISVGSQTFTGNIPNASPAGSVIRQINDVDPVKGTSNPFMNCGQNAQLATDVADAMPGDTISFEWRNGENGNWVHNTGPMLTYMASCGSSPCSQFDSSSASWFKIEQVGRTNVQANTWGQAAMNDGSPAKVQLPSNIAPGNYLIRHELIALQLAMTKGGAEFYPACAQLKIGGNGTGKATQDELVSFPGAYSDTDAGILIDPYSDVTKPYEFPGPAIAAFVNGTSSAGSSTSSNSTSTSATASSSSAASKSTSASGKSCKKRRDTVTELKKRSRPHHISRVMKNFAA